MNVTVLRIEHRHGVNVTVCPSTEVAERVLWEYVKDWWPEEIGRAMPAEHQIAIDEYFEEMVGSEYYALDCGEMNYGDNGGVLEVIEEVFDDLTHGQKAYFIKQKEMWRLC